MTTFINGESGLSVRTKINNAISSIVGMQTAKAEVAGQVFTGPVEAPTLESTGNTTVGGDLVVLGSMIGNGTSAIAIAPGTSNGGDNRSAILSGGGTTADATRGAYVLAQGNEAGGLLELSSGESARVSIHTGTVGASDTQYTELAGGGAASSARGGYIVAYGNEHATNPGKVLLVPGTAVGAEFEVVGDTRLSGTVAAGTTDITGELTFNGDATFDIRAALAGGIAINESGIEMLTVNADGVEISGASRRLWVKSTGGGGTSPETIPAGMGILLTAAEMSATNAFTPAVIFGSTDAQFTSENPKRLAYIVGRATQTYSADTTGGMDLSFWASGAGPGATDAAEEVIRVGYNVSTVMGYVRPALDDGTDIGTATDRFRDLWVGRNIDLEGFLSFGDTDTGIFSSGTKTIAFVTNGTERAYFDGSGRFLIGNDTSVDLAGFVGTVQHHATSGTTWTRGRYDVSSTGVIDLIAKSRSGTAGGTGTALQVNDDVYVKRFYGDHGAGWVLGASYIVEVDVTPAGGNVPMRHVWSVLSSAGAFNEGMRLDSDGFWSLAGDTDTGIRRAAADTLALRTGGTDAVTIDSNRRVLIGHNSAFGGMLQVHNNPGIAGSGMIGVHDWANNATSPAVRTSKSRSGTVGTLGGALTVNTLLGTYQALGDTGSAFVVGGQMLFVAEAGWTATSAPTSFSLQLTPVGSTTPVGVLAVSSAGAITHRNGVSTIVDANSHIGLRSYTVATLPSAAAGIFMIYVTNESGGAQPAFSDGANWRRFTDRAIVS